MKNPTPTSAAKRRTAIAADVLEGDFTMQQIADHFGVSRACINLDFRKLGVPKEKSSTLRRKQRSVQDAMRLREQGRTFGEIEEWTGISSRVLAKAFERKGKPVPPSAPRTGTTSEVLDKKQAMREWMAKKPKDRVSLETLARQLGRSKASLAVYSQMVRLEGPLQPQELLPERLAILRLIHAWQTAPVHQREPIAALQRRVGLKRVFVKHFKRVDFLRSTMGGNPRTAEAWQTVIHGTPEAVEALRERMRAAKKMPKNT
jgi:hypothetical protein